MRILTVLMVLCFFITGCSRVQTYTFKRDRVDQSMEGNRGYMQGDVPAAESREGLKRTMFGVDVEVPILPWEKEVSIPPKPRDDSVEVPPMEEKKTIMDLPEIPGRVDEDISEEDSGTVEEVTVESVVEIKGEQPQEIKGEVVEDEDDWIK